MPSKSRPVTTHKSSRTRGHYKRFLRSPFARHMLIAALVAGYVVGLCYLASFIASHPMLLVAVVAATVVAALWTLSGEES